MLSRSYLRVSALNPFLILVHEEYAVQNTSNKPTPATTLSLPLTVRIPLQARSSKHQMSLQGAGEVLIVRIEMHLAAAMKILRNATNNLQGRLLSQAFFAHLSLFIIYSATVLYLLRRTHHPNSKGLGNRPSPHLQKKLSQHKGPHMQR